MFRLEDLAHHLEMGVEAEHLVDGLRAEPRERHAIGKGETGIRVAGEMASASFQRSSVN